MEVLLLIQRVKSSHRHFVKPNEDICVADMFNNRAQKFAADINVAIKVAGQAEGSGLMMPVICTIHVRYMLMQKIMYLLV